MKKTNQRNTLIQTCEMQRDLSGNQAALGRIEGGDVAWEGVSVIWPNRAIRLSAVFGRMGWFCYICRRRHNLIDVFGSIRICSVSKMGFSRLSCFCVPVRTCWQPPHPKIRRRNYFVDLDLEVPVWLLGKKSTKSEMKKVCFDITISIYVWDSRWQSNSKYLLSSSSILLLINKMREVIVTILR